MLFLEQGQNVSSCADEYPVEREMYFHLCFILVNVIQRDKEFADGMNDGMGSKCVAKVKVLRDEGFN